MIELSDFTKTYEKKETPAVDHVSLVCKKGKITALLGLNGSGKTTILKAICARHFPTYGTVRVEGYDTYEQTEKVRLLTGFVTETADLPPSYTVYEYLSMRASLLEIPAQSIKEAVFRVSRLCSLNDVLGKKIRSLSKGYKERVNFARSLIHNPPVIVLDEPASGLDPSQIIRMRQLVQSLKKDHTIILSTHLMQEVEALSDEVYILHNGHIVAQGTAASIADDAKCATLEDAFFKFTKSTKENLK